MFLLFRPVDTTHLMRENPNDRDIPETLVCLELRNSVIRGRELSGARLAQGNRHVSVLRWETTPERSSSGVVIS
jgi:hypothetical protein